MILVQLNLTEEITGLKKYTQSIQICITFLPAIQVRMINYFIRYCKKHDQLDMR